MQPDDGRHQWQYDQHWKAEYDRQEYETVLDSFFLLTSTAMGKGACFPKTLPGFLPNIHRQESWY